MAKNVQSKINPIWRRNHPAVRISPPNISRKDTLGRWSTPSLSVKALIGDSSPGPAFSSSPGTTPSPSDSPPPGSASSAPGLPAASSVGTPTSSTSVFSSKSSSSFILYFFSAILNLALRLRGFARCSSSPGTITLLWTALSGQSTLP